VGELARIAAAEITGNGDAARALSVAMKFARQDLARRVS
jgi:hypothetical protein